MNFLGVVATVLCVLGYVLTLLLWTYAPQNCEIAQAVIDVVPRFSAEQRYFSELNLEERILWHKCQTVPQAIGVAIFLLITIFYSVIEIKRYLHVPVTFSLIVLWSAFVITAVGGVFLCFYLFPVGIPPNGRYQRSMLYSDFRYVFFWASIWLMGSTLFSWLNVLGSALAQLFVRSEKEGH